MGFAPPFTVRTESRNGVARVEIGGELDMATVPLLEEPLSALEGNGVSAILLDLRDVTFLDTSAVHAFVGARERAEAGGKRLVLIGASDRARRVLHLTGTRFLLDEKDAAGVIEPYTRSDRRGAATSGGMEGGPGA